MYSDDDLIPISALQHFAFCPRQCALIHVEQIWDENFLTAQGRVLHERVHEEKTERRRDFRVEHGVALRSLALGLIGKSDVVEFHRREDGPWRAFPVEYKRGRNKPDNRDKVQLCAQALCLEEMLGRPVTAGAIYYGRERRRTDVEFDDSLRGQTREIAGKVRELIAAGVTPPPVYEKKCEACSLLEVCMPRALGVDKRVTDYFSRMVDQ
jgi:CRISPR-associated exonuclease Cas4